MEPIIMSMEKEEGNCRIIQEIELRDGRIFMRYKRRLITPSIGS